MTILLKRIVEQQDLSGQYYDLGRDFANFRRAIDGSFEQVKAKFEQSIGSKLVGRRVRAKASRGYKQYVKDYEFDVVKITLDDYYDNYVVVAQDSTTPKPKEFFLKPGFKITILGPATGQPSPQKGGPDKSAGQTPKAGTPITPQATPQTRPDAAQHQQMALAPAGATPSERPLEGKTKTEPHDVYSIDDIAIDIRPWLPRILAKPDTALRDFIKGLGAVKSFEHGKVVAIFDLVIPKDSLKINIDKNVMTNVLRALNKQGTIGITYDLVKMEYDQQAEVWNVRIKKTMQYNTPTESKI